MIPEYPVFKPIEAADLTELAAVLDLKKPEESELSLANLFIWKDFDRPQATRINGNICILLHPLNEEPFFLEPLGEARLIDTVETCLKYAKRLSRVSEALSGRLEQEAYRICTVRGQFDYLYLREELAGFRGKKFDGKRNHVKRFKRVHPDWTYVPLEPSRRGQVFTLFETWCCEKRDTLYFQRLDEESQHRALSRAFDGFMELGMLGGAVQAAGRILGFILGSPLNSDTLTVHFQYGDPEAPGVMQVLLQESAAQTFSGFTYLNLEQDLGIGGLRTSKLSYHPLKLIKKYQIEPV